MTLKFINKEKGVDDIPSMTNIVVINDEFATLAQVVEAFKIFLVGCTYGEDLVDRIVLLDKEEEL